jgi:general stress protein 26
MAPVANYRTRHKGLILKVLDEHRVMAIATNRPDGWPQATLVGYVNDGFLLYCFVARSSQKHANILRDPRVSVAIGSDAPRPLDIKGLSFAGTASVVSDPGEIEHISDLRLKRYPEYATVPPPLAQTGTAQRISRRPSHDVILLRIAPDIISVLDYSKGFGHADLVTFSERDLDVHIGSHRHRWDDNVVADRSPHDSDER